MSNDTPPADDASAPTLRAGTGEVPRIDLKELTKTQPFEAGPLIGKGGMGEVRQCRDARLERHIALKTATTKDAAELSRFVREARVQGQLEHPGIVPVYELGIGSDGAPYFAMKRVRGETLLDVLALLGAGDAAAKEKYPRRRLLQAFVSVCQAVDYAHTNGWIHRDLKPANVMLGDFGEVYVLDWGLARHVGDPSGLAAKQALEVLPIGLTTPGTLMGTPGYMSPEQVVGQPADVRSDVYSLGAMLFELLTGQMLARGKTPIELLKDTNTGCDARARQRAPTMDVAPELEVVCAKATAKNPGERYRSVRELHDAVDRVLAGERDDELRAAMAKRHTDAAKEIVARAAADAANELELRKAALRELGQALALAPTYRPALEKLIELMATPARTAPPELKQELSAGRATQRRAAMRAACFLFLGLAFFGTPFARAQHLWPQLLFAGCSLLTAGFAAYAAWRRSAPDAFITVGLSTLTSVTIMATFPLVGPLKVLPLLAAVTAAVFATSTTRRLRPFIAVMGVITTLVPLFGSWAGALPESFRFTPEGLLLLPIEEVVHPTYTPLVLAGIFAAAVILATLIVGSVSDTVTRLTRRNALQAWSLKQMLPPEATATPATTLSKA